MTVATSVEAVCAVAYGETEALGRLATDQDMGGAGHSDDAAVLTELTPALSTSTSCRVGDQTAVYT